MPLSWRIARQSFFFHEGRKITLCELARLDQDCAEHPVVSLRNVAAVGGQGNLGVVQFGDESIACLLLLRISYIRWPSADRRDLWS